MRPQLGAMLTDMLITMTDRGPDSAGIAIYGTGQSADAPGYRVGGKTGSAEKPSAGGYRKKLLVSTFAAAFPMDNPRYVVVAMLDAWRDKATVEALKGANATAFAMVYDDPIGTVNAGNEVQFFNPPIVGKKISVKGRIADKYLRRDKPYIVIEATAIDEDGRLLEKLSTYQLKKPDELGKKWHPEQK